MRIINQILGVEELNNAIEEIEPESHIANKYKQDLK